MNWLRLIIATVVLKCSETKLQNNDDKIVNEIQHLTNVIASRYFSEALCVGVITEIPCISLVESNLPVFYITIDRNNNTSDSQLLAAINSGCLAFVVQVNDIKWMVEKFTALFRSPSSVNRANRRYIYLPTSVTNGGIFSKTVMNEVFSCQSMNWMPDLLIVNLLTGKEVLGNNMSFLQQIGSNGEEHFWEMSQEIDFVLEIYTHKYVGKDPSKTVLLDVWVPDQGFVYEMDLFPDKVKNLQGKKVKTMSIPYMPFTVMMLDTEPAVFDGIEFQALFAFGKKHNITWIVQYDLENWWGEVWDNGSGVGIIGSMAEDRTDFALTALYMLHRGFSYMDYSVAFYQSGLTAVTPKPKMLPPWLIPARPFTSYMWYAVLISVIVIIILLYVLSKSSNLLFGRGTAGPYSTLLESSFRTTGMLLLQVPDEQVDYVSRPLRHLVAWVVLYFLVISSAYAGGLSAILTLPQYQPPIETISDLADSGLKWYGTDEAYIFPIYNSTDPTLKKIIRNYVVRSEEEIIKLAYDDNSSLLVERLQGGYFTHLKYISEDVMENKRLMREAIVPEHLVFALCKGSAYKEYFNSILHKLRQSGIPLYWEGEMARKYLSQRLQLSILESREPANSFHIKLSFSHVKGAFFLLVLGLLLALVVFVLELVQFYSTEKKKREANTAKRHTLQHGSSVVTHQH